MFKARLQKINACADHLMCETFKNILKGSDTVTIKWHKPIKYLTDLIVFKHLHTKIQFALK